MKQALEIEDLPELAKLLTAAEARIIFLFQNGRFATGVADKKIRFIKIGRAVRFKKTHLEPLSAG
jgi:hypothetical protein